MGTDFVLDRLGRADRYVPSFAMAIVIALAAVAPRATVPVLFVIFAVQLASSLRTRALPRFDVPVIFAAGIFVVWAYISTAWALAPTIEAGTRLLLLLVSGFFIIARARGSSGDERMLRALSIGFALAVLMYLFEMVSWGWLTRLAHNLVWRDIIDDQIGGTSVMALLINGVSIMIVFFWPAVTGFVSCGRRWGCAVIAVATIGVSVCFGNETGMIAIVLGGIVWWLAAIGGQKIFKALAALFVVFVLATPFVVHRALTVATIDRVIADVPHAPTSALVRLMIWKFTAERILERPLLGWGFDAARRIPGGGDQFMLRNASGQIITSELNLPLHPHNQILQVWLELGIVGALVVALSGAWIVLQAAKLPPVARSGSMALFTSVLVFDCLSYGAWQSWWIAAVLLAAATQVSMNAWSRRGDADYPRPR